MPTPALCARPEGPGQPGKTPATSQSLWGLDILRLHLWGPVGSGGKFLSCPPTHLSPLSPPSPLPLPPQAQIPAWWGRGEAAKVKEQLPPPAPLPCLQCQSRQWKTGGWGGESQQPRPRPRVAAGFPPALVVMEEEEAEEAADSIVGSRGQGGRSLCATEPPTNPGLALCCVAEFDKFLEERAKAAEMVPSLPSPPAEAPASNPSGRKKPERSEDALFAL